MEEYIAESLATGDVCRSASPASAGFFFVEKDKTLRPCIDYRGLTVKNSYPYLSSPQRLNLSRGPHIFFQFGPSKCLPPGSETQGG